MTELFMKLLNMSINAGWLVLTVLLVRIIFRKAPKWLFPVLWSFVGIRLLMPNALESRLSVIPDISGFSASEQGLLSAKGFTAPVPYVGIVWCTGMAAMLLFEALSYVHLRSKVKTAVRLSSNVYQSEHVNAPFILGLFAPRIYIPFHIKSKELDSIIAHERAHIKRRDHWLKPIAFLILSLYWFNPLIWIAYYFLCKDIELACDEYAIKDMSDSQRAAYSQTLLSCTANQRIFAACPLAFGSKNVKTRIRAVLSYRKPHTWIITVTAILVLAVVACFMTNPRQPKESSWEIAAIPIILATITGIIVGILTMNATTLNLFSSVSEVLNTSLSGAATIGYNDMITEVVSMPIAVIVAGVLQLIVYIVATYLHLQRLAQRSPLELVRKG